MKTNQNVFLESVPFRKVGQGSEVVSANLDQNSFARKDDWTQLYESDTEETFLTFSPTNTPV